MDEISSVLPPLLGVRFAWALTGTFQSEVSAHSGEEAILNHLATPLTPYACDLANPVQSILKNLYDLKEVSEKERNYIQKALISIYAHMRSLATVYCARELNFKENEVLRLEYLNFIKNNINFGADLRDWLKALPTIIIGGISGIAIADNFGISGIMFWAIGILCAIIGFVIYEWWMVYSCRRKQWTYVSLDYEHALYYKHYLKRVKNILTNLYYDLNDIHKDIFGISYPVRDTTSSNQEEIDQFIEHLFNGVRPTLCPEVYRCMAAKGSLNCILSKIKAVTCDNPLTPELWPLCETSDDEAREYCAMRPK